MRKLAGGACGYGTFQIFATTEDEAGFLCVRDEKTHNCQVKNDLFSYKMHIIINIIINTLRYHSS